MRGWKTLVRAILFAFFFLVVMFGGLWLFLAPVGTGASVVVDGVTVAEESTTDYTQLIIPGLVLLAGIVGLTGATTSLWRVLAAGTRS